MKSKITCTVIGDAMVDLVFPLSNNNDVKYIMQGGVTSTKSKITLGGTANVAFWISKLGCNSAFIGKIGNDCFGNYIKKDLRVNKIKDGLAISSEYNTGLVIVLVLPTKERFFIVDRGANIDLKMQDVNFDFCLNSKYLYICGYSFQDKITKETVQKVIKEATSNGVNIVFNPATPNLCKKYKNEFLDIIKNYVDLLVLNEREGKELVGDSGEKAVEDLLDYGARIVAWTMGAKGSIIGNKKDRFRIKASKVKVVDTTGAGDAYASAVIVGLDKGWNIPKIGEFASKAAGEIVGRLGARI